MKELVEFELEDGSKVLFESEAAADDGGPVRIARGGGGEGEVRQAAERFEAVARRIRPAAQLVLDALRDLNSPKEIGLEFGLKFSAKAGVIFAAADSEASFKVTVKWVNPQ